jgi:hypothetical protein
MGNQDNAQIKRVIEAPEENRKFYFLNCISKKAKVLENTRQFLFQILFRT